MDNFTFEGFKVDFFNIRKDNKKLCGKAPSFNEDMSAFAKLAIGHYVENGTFLGSRVPSSFEKLETYKQRSIITCWSTGTRDGYRIYYMVIKNNFIFCLVYVKAKNNIDNETNYFKQAMINRFG